MDNLSHIERLLPELRAYARSICSLHSNAEDLVQDTVERALRAENRPTPIDELRP
jgi:RNA polymerase sigma-70 factor (ECF subfamily)